jgi:cytochrome P450
LVNSAKVAERYVDELRGRLNQADESSERQQGDPSCHGVEMAMVIMDATVPDPDLVPFEPPDHATFRAAFRNVVESYPRALYDGQGMVRYRTRFLDSVLISKPELIHDVLVTRAELFRRSDMARRLLSLMLGSNSLLMAEGADWKWQRRAVAPAFRHDRLLALVPTFSMAAKRQAERWRRALRGQSVEIAGAMAQTTFEVIADTVLGGPGDLDAAKFARSLTTVMDTFPWRFILSVFRAPAWLPYPGRWRAARARAHIYREAARCLAQRRRTPSARADLLDLLLQASDAETGRSMDDDELVHNLVTFIVAGHETTAVALTWTLWLLAKYPRLQDQVAAEAQATIGSGDVEPQHIERLKLARQVLQEAMRLYPPVPAISKQPLISLVLGGQALTPTTEVTIAIYPLHRNRSIWKNPDSFDPGRFADEQNKARPSCSYLPFGAGPRVCIGASFAVMEATVILALLVRDFRFKVVAGHRPHPVARVTLRPRDGMPLYVEPR